MKNRFVVCLTTAASKRDAEKIARHLVEKKFAACVNVSPVLSFYTWKKKLCRTSEVLLVIKTASSRARLLEVELQKIHPYELPEFVVLPIAGGSRKYFQWITGSVAKR